MLVRRLDRGDTLIEVLFAITVFSLIIVTSLSIMNQGIAAAQRSLEITQVRQQIDGQADTLRFLHDSYVAVYRTGVTSADLTGPAKQWALIMETSSVSVASPFSSTATCERPSGRDFIVNPKTATFVSTSTMPTLFNTDPTTFARLTYNAGGTLTGSQGVWVEAVRSAISPDPTRANVGYVDFHIRSCWYTPGLSSPMTIGTIVRLYEPRG